MALCSKGHNANSIRLRRVILLRSDIRPSPSDIRYASFGRRIEYNCSVYRTISLLRQQKYHAVADSISLKTIRKCALAHHTKWRIIEKSRYGIKSISAFLLSFRVHPYPVARFLIFRLRAIRGEECIPQNAHHKDAPQNRAWWPQCRRG